MATEGMGGLAKDPGAYGGLDGGFGGGGYGAGGYGPGGAGGYGAGGYGGGVGAGGYGGGVGAGGYGGGPGAGGYGGGPGAGGYGGAGGLGRFGGGYGNLRGQRGQGKDKSYGEQQYPFGAGGYPQQMSKRYDGYGGEGFPENGGLHGGDSYGDYLSDDGGLGYPGGKAQQKRSGRLGGGKL
ncbi:acanthoscurrin-2-like isoform X3 [Lethenteron reissneri]|uniref:acanthoscurrin-2-like isoform X3 n=1 Tax=Lethenteron reissneri TaxID=7753 RepID=UPI002AB6CA1A|nr:acanthoscurrin-2-like isoform X3 [Lethenteron reissneri]